MKPRIVAALVALMIPCNVVAETPPQELSAQYCAVLRLEYGVTPPACAPRTASPPITTEVVSQPASVRRPAPQISESVRTSHVFFPNSGAKLDDAARDQLVGLAELLGQQELRDTCLLLIGHSDSSGNEDINRQLSRARADAVGDFLSTLLANPAAVAIAPGKGSVAPLEGFSASATANRRVAIMARRCP